MSRDVGSELAHQHFHFILLAKATKLKVQCPTPTVGMSLQNYLALGMNREKDEKLGPITPLTTGRYYSHFLEEEADVQRKLVPGSKPHSQAATNSNPIAIEAPSPGSCITSHQNLAPLSLASLGSHLPVTDF